MLSGWVGEVYLEVIFLILYFLFFYVDYLCFGGWNGEVYALCENEINEAVHRLTDNISIYIYLGGSGM